MVVGEGRDLGQVGDAQDLLPRGHRLELPAHHLGDPAADAGVHLVEHEREPRGIGAHDGLEPQHDARQLPTGGDARQRTQLLSGVRGEQELRPLESPLGPLGRIHDGLRVRRGEGHLETRLFHRQLRELGLHALAQVERRGPAPLRQRARSLEVGRPQPLAPRLERPLLLLRRGQEVELAAAALAKRDDLFDRRAVLLLEPLDDREAALDLVEAARAHLELLLVVAQAKRQVLEGRERLRPRVEEALERGVDRREVLHPAKDQAEARERGALVVVEQTVGLAAERREAPRVGLPCLLHAQGLLLARREAGLLDLGRLELEHLAPALGLAPVSAEALERGLGRAQVAEELGQGPAVVGAREVVEQIHVGRGVEQALRLVLAVNHGQAGGEVAQKAHGDERAVHGGAALAARLELAANDHLVSVRAQPALFEQGGRAFHLEHGLDGGALFARPDQLRRGPVAQEQTEGVDQDRLSGPGFARQERQAGAELDLERRNEGDVVDPQQFKHAQRDSLQNITALGRL